MMMVRHAGCQLCGLRCLLALVVTVSTSFPGMAGCYGRHASEPQSRFRVLGNEVEDTLSGLEWQRCSYGSEWNGKDRCVGQIAYLGLDEAMSAAADGWRVPSGPELESLVDPACGCPVVDQSVFPDIRPDEEGQAKYWTTSAMGTLDLYWNFDFIDGHADANSKGIQLAVRFVRTKR